MKIVQNFDEKLRHVVPKISIKNAIKIIIIFIILVALYNSFSTSLPNGLSYQGSKRNLSDIQFLYDLTYVKDGERIIEQSIFDKQLELIKEAKNFIILDMFLFNNDYDKTNEFPNISEILTRELIAQKQNNKDLKIYFITDEINNFYGAYQSPYLKELSDNGIEVIVTDLDKLRDSNPIYSGFWRTLINWSGTSGKGWIKNAFSPDSPNVTLRAYLKLLNFKANHRKVLVTENAAIVSSSNPHDASGFHSNIGFLVKGEIINDFIQSEGSVAKLSGVDLKGLEYIDRNSENTDEITVSVITESKIKENLIENIKKTNQDDEIRMGIFYLADRSIVKELIKASDRGAKINIVLDANKDAFGVEKNGIPNRQVANELVQKSNSNINIRWYYTTGEQFHTKLTYFKMKENVVIIGGSANYTRRNLDDYNLETNVMIETTTNSEIAIKVKGYFDRIWNNKDGEYTLDFDKYKETSKLKAFIYRFQEWSGLCTF